MILSVTSATMAKSAVFTEQLEVILSTVLMKMLPEIMVVTLEKFETQIDLLMARVEARFDKKIEHILGEPVTANSRVDVHEAKVVQLAASSKQPLTSNAIVTDVAGIIELTLRALILMEK